MRTNYKTLDNSVATTRKVACYKTVDNSVATTRKVACFSGVQLKTVDNKPTLLSRHMATNVT
jgi:hypothetical protein